MGLPNYRRQNALFKYVALFGFAVLLPYVSPSISRFLMRQATDAPGLEKYLDQHQRGKVRHKCFDGSNGWEYVCDSYITWSDGTLHKARFGVTMGPMGPGALEQFPPEAGSFIPSREQINRYVSADQRFCALVDLNDGDEKRLATLPGMDKTLAERIVVASQQNRFVVMEDVLRVEGMDQRKLDRIRSMIRVDFKGRPRFEDFVQPGASSN